MADSNRKTTTIEDHVARAEVFDTHTHLDTSANVAAEDVWDILHYFWFQRELQAAGYPANAAELPEQARREAFLAAFEGSRNTYWNTIVRRMLRDLFDCTLETLADFDALTEKIETTSKDPEWPVTVCEKIGVRNIVVGTEPMSVSDSFRSRLIVVPFFSIAGLIPSNGSVGQGEMTDRVNAELDSLISGGHRTIRVDLEPMLSGRVACENPASDEDRLYHSVLEKLDRAGTRIQVFTGMKRDWKIHTMLNDPARIVRLYPVFDQYPNAQFEFLNAATGNDLDILQAARVFPNVHPGGLWWFNFRASSYRSMMQQRFEALPTSRSSIVASDARCVEWQYGKVLYVKTVLAQFLQEQVDSGWTDEEGAIRAADDWLFRTAQSAYR
jgi:glucuronate isomerase